MQAAEQSSEQRMNMASEWPGTKLPVLARCYTSTCVDRDSMFIDATECRFVTARVKTLIPQQPQLQR